LNRDEKGGKCTKYEVGIIIKKEVRMYIGGGTAGLEFLKTVNNLRRWSAKTNWRGVSRLVKNKIGLNWQKTIRDKSGKSQTTPCCKVIWESKSAYTGGGGNTGGGRIGFGAGYNS